MNNWDWGLAVTKCKFCGIFLPNEGMIEKHYRVIHVKDEDNSIDNAEE